MVAGVTQSSRLIRQMSLMTARSLTQSSPVYSITGSVSWIETTSQSSFSSDPEDGLPVSLINDLDIISTPKISFMQANPAKQPIYKNSNFNGLPSLSFDGIDDELVTTDSNKINQSVYINGSLDVTRANTADMNFSHSNTIAIEGNNGNMFTKCDIAEVIIFDRSLKAEERKSIEQYFGKKWKITVS